MSGRLEVFFCDTYAAAETDFDTTRKAAHLAQDLVARPIPGVVLVAPEPASRGDLRRVHDVDYVEAVLTGEPRHLASSAGLGWDPGLVEALLASTGGCVGAARAAWRDGVAGSLSSGLHHAGSSRGAGFCTFNGLALAARVFGDLGAEHVLVLDLDAHCGGGTHEILGRDPGVATVDVSTDGFDRYRPAKPSTLDVIDHARDYLPVLSQRLDALPLGSVDAVVYNAGMDPHQDCGTGGLRGITDRVLARREDLVFSWAGEHGVPIAFVLAGGYSSGAMGRSHLTRLHRLTVAAAARAAAAGQGSRRSNSPASAQA